MDRWERFADRKRGKKTILVFKVIVPTSFPVIKVASIKLSDLAVKDSGYFSKLPRLFMQNCTLDACLTGSYDGWETL